MSEQRGLLMYTGDRKPDLRITLSDSAGDGVDATEAALVRVIGKRGSVEVFDAEADTVTVDGLTSIVTHAWGAGETDTAGWIAVEVEVTWPDGKLQTFRPEAGVKIVADFDAA